MIKQKELKGVNNMTEYIGMNFREWCDLDTEDMRTLNIILRTNSNTYIFNSNMEIEYIDILMLRQSTITDIELNNDEWYIELVLDNK